MKLSLPRCGVRVVVIVLICFVVFAVITTSLAQQQQQQNILKRGARQRSGTGGPKGPKGSGKGRKGDDGGFQNVRVGYGLISAIEEGVVKANVTATTFRWVNARLESTVSTPIEVAVLPGSILESPDRAYMPLVVVQRRFIRLAPRAVKDVILATQSVTTQRKIPGGSSVENGVQVPVTRWMIAHSGTDADNSHPITQNMVWDAVDWPRPERANRFASSLLHIAGKGPKPRPSLPAELVRPWTWTLWLEGRAPILYLLAGLLLLALILDGLVGLNVAADAATAANGSAVSRWKTQISAAANPIDLGLVVGLCYVSSVLDATPAQIIGITLYANEGIFGRAELASVVLSLFGFITAGLAVTGGAVGGGTGRQLVYALPAIAGLCGWLNAPAFGPTIHLRLPVAVLMGCLVGVGMRLPGLARGLIGGVGKLMAVVGRSSGDFLVSVIPNLIHDVVLCVVASFILAFGLPTLSESIPIPLLPVHLPVRPIDWAAAHCTDLYGLLTESGLPGLWFTLSALCVGITIVRVVVSGMVVKGKHEEAAAHHKPE